VESSPGGLRADGDRWRWVALGGYAAALAGLTLAPIGWRLNRLTVRLYVLFRYDVPVAPGWAGPEQYGDLLNVLLYVPPAFLLAGTRLRWWGALLVCVAVSVATELTQELVGRQGEVGDVVCNATGAVVGVLLAGLLRRRARRRPAAGRTS